MSLKKLMGFLFALILIGSTGWFIYTNLNRILALFSNKPAPRRSKRIYDSSGQPLANVFYLYDHESVDDWSQWMQAEDISKKDIALKKLTDYINQEPEALGPVTADVVKAIVEFQRPSHFNHLSHFMTRARDNWDAFKEQGNAYTACAIGLTKLNPDAAETFLLQEFNQAKGKSDAPELLQAIITAVCSLEFNNTVKTLFLNILSEQSIKFDVKKEVLDKIEKQDIEVQKEIFKAYFEKQLSLNTGKINKDDELVLESVFNKVKRYITSEFDSEIWKLTLDTLSKKRLSPTMVKQFCELLSQTSSAMSNKQILELLIKPSTAKNKFAEAIASKFKLSENELSLTKPQYDKNETIYEKVRLDIERARKSRTVAHDLLDEYKILEKLIINGLDAKDKGSGGCVKVLSGGAEKDKIYLLRALGANHSWTLINIDIDSFLKSDIEFKNFEHTVSNSKPCIVYFDNIESLLKKDLDKEDRNKVKEMFRIIKELASLPTIFFTGNIPYNKPEIKSVDKTMFDNLSKASHGSYRIIRELKNPDDKLRKKIFKNHQVKVMESRMMDSLSFNLDELIKETEGMSTLDFLEYTRSFFEISLLLEGKLLPIGDFKTLLTEKIQIEAKYADCIGADEFEGESIDSEADAIESAV